MKWIEFFIERPVTACVINVMLIIIGALSFGDLLIDEYPHIVVPQLSVTTRYHNASAQTVEKELTNIIEEAMSMVEGVESISSSSKSGESEVFLRFSTNVPMDRAVMQVSEQLSRITSTLPADAETPELIRGGHGGGDAFMFLKIRSALHRGAALTHIARTRIKPHFQGIAGVAEIDVMGQPFAMNVVLDTLAMHSQRVGPEHIYRVLKQNERLLQAGRMASQEPISLDVVAQDAEDYRRMIISKNGDVPVRIGDVASVSLETDESQMKIRIDGENSVILGVHKAPDGNTLSVAQSVKNMIDKVNAELRNEAVVTIASDKSIFVERSLQAIFRTIFEACILVILIIFLFLRHLRATLVPLVTIPISLVATFAALKIFGLSINTITMMAMVLAVGLVVDDAIVVLENIFRYREQGLSSFEAAKKGASEIGFAIIAMTCTLMSVFLPLVFVSDLTGVVLREFAITLASAVFFSGIVALTLSPLMSAVLLKHQPKEGKISLAIEHAIAVCERGYLSLLHMIFPRRHILFGAMIILLGLGLYAYNNLQTNLLPKEDRGLIGAFIPKIPGLNIDEMEYYAAQVEQIFVQQPGIELTLVHAFANRAFVVAVLKPWEQRTQHAEEIVATIRDLVNTIPTVTVYPWNWDSGLEVLKDDSNENAGVVVALKTVGSYDELEEISQRLAERIRNDNLLVDARSDLDMNEKAYSIKIYREPAAALGIDEKAVSMALQAYTNRMRASEFKLDGQRYALYLEADRPIDDISSIYISTKNNDLVPLSTVAKVSQEVQAPVLKHLNQMRTANVLASLGPTMSLSEAKEYLDKIVDEIVPKHYSVEYKGSLAMQKKSGQTFLLLFFAGLIFIFAVMAIQFEGVLDPLIILVTVPFACVGGVLILWLTNASANLFTQVGMLTLIGLITKHGILLTEFVAQQRREKMPLKDAVFLAAQLRFRPIVMTTAAMVLGALPLVMGHGAGVEARASIGLVIVGGMVFGTLLTLFVLPAAIYSVHAAKARFFKTT